MLKTLLFGLVLVIGMSGSFIMGMKWQVYQEEKQAKLFFDYNKKVDKEQEKQDLAFFNIK